MLLRKISKLTVAIVLCTALFFTGCSKNGGENASTNTEKSNEKEVTVLVSSDLKPEEADTISGINEDFRLFEMVYDPLVRYGEGGEIEPALAKKWEISEDGKEYTFYLRDDVKFSDGSDFNADTVLFNASRWEDKLTFSAELKDVKKVDDYTVTFVFDDVAYSILTEFTYPRPYRILGEKSLDEEDNFKEMIGTGQWMVESYKTNQEVVMVPNPYYYGDKPKVDRIILKQVDDGQARIMAMQSGDADICLADIPSESRQIIDSEESLDTIEGEPVRTFYLILNYENEQLQDERVRQALNYGIDKESIVNTLLDGDGIPATGIFPSSTPYVTEENSKGYPYDVDKARELLAEAGYKDTNSDGILEKNGEKLSFRLVFQTEEYSNWKTLCEYLQSEYAKIGIEIKLEQMESTGYYDAIWSTRDYDMLIYRSYEDSWNPHGFLSSMFYQTEGNQAVCWYDEEISKEIGVVLKTLDEEKRTELYNSILSKMNDRAVTVPLYYPKNAVIYNKEQVTGLKIAPTSYEGLCWDEIDVLP